MDKTISIPFVVLVWLLMSTVLGRAIAIIKADSAKIRITNNAGFNFVNNDFDCLKPWSELIFKVVDCVFLVQKYHAIAIGINKNNQKKPGFKKVTFVIICYLF
jgi:hypothetical protein